MSDDNEVTFSLLHYTVQMSEEIVRWAFEVAVMQRPLSHIVFTNPTAGPWKLVQMKSAFGTYEIHRFGREDERPDVIIVCDDIERIYVIEAKEDLKKLDDSTIDKTFELTSFFRRRFNEFDKHTDWFNRRAYTTSTGFIFGSRNRDAASHELEQLSSRVSSLGYDPAQTYSCAIVCENNRTTLLEGGFPPSLFSASD